MGDKGNIKIISNTPPIYIPRLSRDKEAVQYWVGAEQGSRIKQICNQTPIQPLAS